MGTLIREAIGTGETLEIAKEAACNELGVESHEAEFEILQSPAKGTLGLFGKKDAKVKAIVRVAPLDKALEYLNEMLRAMQLHDVEIKVDEKEDSADIYIFGEEAWNLVGKRGETLNSIQYLLGLVANNCYEDSYFRINLDIENYRERREKSLKSLAHKTAKDTLRTKRKRFLEPMNPYERKIIHMEIESIDGVVSWSEGENQARHVVVGLESFQNKNKTEEIKETTVALYEKLN